MGQPAGWPKFLLGREDNEFTAKTTVDPGINHLERASSGRPFLLSQG
jgi:hypothetical protein